MPDINLDRLEDIANVPELAEADEVRSIAQLLMEAQGILILRNHQNHTLSSLTDEAGVRMRIAEFKHNRLQQIVIGSLTGLALTAFVWFMLTQV